MSYGSSCGCGETSERVAIMTRTTTAYMAQDIPTLEIDQNIGWLSQQIEDIEYRISELERLKKERARVQKWRDDLNDLAKQFCDDDALEMDIDTRASIIQQRLGCDWSRAYLLAKKVQQHAKDRLRFFRDQQIRYEHGLGLKPAEIAKKHDITRQQVYNVLKKDARKEWSGKTVYLDRLLKNQLL